MAKEKCKAISPYDQRECEYPAGHTYQHGGGGARKSWGTAHAESCLCDECKGQKPLFAEVK